MMVVLEIIGWAFIAGCALAAFIAPVAALLWLFKDTQPATVEPDDCPPWTGSHVGENNL